MAFTPATFNRLNVGSVQVYAYETVDAIATVTASAYFDDVADEIKLGSIILVSDTNTPTIDVIVVTSASGVTPVTTLNGT